MVRVEGQMTGRWVAEVREYCQSLLDQGLSVTLDLEEVSFLDRSGVSLLRELTTRRVRFVNCSPFLVEILKTSEA